MQSGAVVVVAGIQSVSVSCGTAGFAFRVLFREGEVMRGSVKPLLLAGMNLVIASFADIKFAIMVASFSAGWCLAFAVVTRDLENEVNAD